MPDIEIPDNAPILTTRLQKPILALLYVSLFLTLPIIVLSIFPRRADPITFIVTTLLGSVLPFIFNITLVILTHKDIKRRRKLLRTGDTIVPVPKSPEEAAQDPNFPNNYRAIRIPAIACLPSIIIAFVFAIILGLSAAYEIFITVIHSQWIRELDEELTSRLRGNRLDYLQDKRHYLMISLVLSGLVCALVLVQLVLIVVIASFAVVERKEVRGYAILDLSGDSRGTPAILVSPAEMVEVRQPPMPGSRDPPVMDTQPVSPPQPVTAPLPLTGDEDEIAVVDRVPTTEVDLGTPDALQSKTS